MSEKVLDAVFDLGAMIEASVFSRASVKGSGTRVRNHLKERGEGLILGTGFDVSRRKTDAVKVHVAIGYEFPVIR